MQKERAYNMILPAGSVQGTKVYFNNLKDIFGKEVDDLQFYPTFLNDRGPVSSAALGPTINMLPALIISTIRVNIYKGNSREKTFIDLPLIQFVFAVGQVGPGGLGITTKKTWRISGDINWDQSYIECAFPGTTPVDYLLNWNILYR